MKRFVLSALFLAVLVALGLLAADAVADTTVHQVCRSTSAQISDFDCHGPRSSATLGDGGWWCSVFGSVKDLDGGLYPDPIANGMRCEPGAMNGAAITACSDAWKALHCP